MKSPPKANLFNPKHTGLPLIFLMLRLEHLVHLVPQVAGKLTPTD